MLSHPEAGGRAHVSGEWALLRPQGPEPALSFAVSLTLCPSSLSVIKSCALPRHKGHSPRSCAQLLEPQTHLFQSAVSCWPPPPHTGPSTPSLPTCIPRAGARVPVASVSGLAHVRAGSPEGPGSPAAPLGSLRWQLTSKELQRSEPQGPFTPSGLPAPGCGPGWRGTSFSPVPREWRKTKDGGVCFPGS